MQASRAERLRIQEEAEASGARRAVSAATSASSPEPAIGEGEERALCR